MVHHLILFFSLRKMPNAYEREQMAHPRIVRAVNADILGIMKQTLRSFNIPKTILPRRNRINHFQKANSLGPDS